jgi:hypothetical protein
MEFDDLKKIWDAQNNRPLYVIDEKALHSRIQSKMKSALLYTNITEWGSIISNLFSAGVLIAIYSLRHGANVLVYIEAAWMIATVVFVAAHRARRISSGHRFDRSIHGDLDHAISIATFQVHLVRILSLNILPLGAIAFLIAWGSGQLLKACIFVLLACPPSFYVGIKGNRKYVRRKRALQVLKEKLEAGS